MHLLCTQLLPDAEAGRAYAFAIELPAGQSAAQVSATFYQANAAAGSAGFEATVGGPMGRWRDTPPGHHSYAEHHGCSNEDRSCISSIAASYGIHPGGSYGSVLKGTWVAPADGKWLLRVVANCDVVFYSDVEAEGCDIDDSSYGCHTTPDHTYNSDCASTLQVTVTPDAYFDDDSSSAGGQQQSGGASDGRSGPVAGSAERTDTIVLRRADVEAQAAAVFDATPAAERTLAAPPTLEEMLVGGSEANALLTSMLTVEQQPHVVYPLTIEAVASDGGGGGHRRMQRTGEDLHIQIATHAPTPQEAQKAVDRIIAATGGAVVVGGGGGGRGRRLLVEAAHTATATSSVVGADANQSAHYGAPNRSACSAEREQQLEERLAQSEGELAAALIRVAQLESERWIE
eukprot:COSAG06_NODE_508_length_14925_cov_18.648995_3_plen_402_part_00